MRQLHHPYPFRLCALAAMIVGLSGYAWAGDLTPSADEPAAQVRAEAIADIGNAREGTIIDLVNQWSPAAAALGYPADAWATEFAGMLEGATNAQLYDIQNAANYDNVRAILQGRSTPVSLDGVVGAEALGDSGSDLTFTPSVPCRVIDSRYDTDGATKPATFANYNYYVWGSAALLYTQGHNLGVNAGPGCPAPKGEPAGIAANFTVANPAANGNIRAWPYGGAVPTVSLLNYQPNTNLANAGIVATCYSCGPDMSMRSEYGSTHWVVDTMGFFYPSGATALACTSVYGPVTAVPVNAWTNVDAYCPSGYSATGGGSFPVEGTLGYPGLWVTDSPNGSTGWRLWVNNQTNGSRNLQAVVQCCRVPGM